MFSLTLRMFTIFFFPQENKKFSIPFWVFRVLLCNCKEVGKVINSHFCRVHSEIYGSLQQTSKLFFHRARLEPHYLLNVSILTSGKSQWDQGSSTKTVKKKGWKSLPAPKPFLRQCHLRALKASFTFYLHVRASQAGNAYPRTLDMQCSQGASILED